FGNGGSGGDPNTLYFTAGLHRVGAGNFGAMDGLFGSVGFADTADKAVPVSRGVSDPVSALFRGDVVPALLGPASLDRRAVPAEKAGDSAQVLSPPNIRSVDQVFSSVREKDQAFVSSGLKQAPVSVDGLGLTLFPADDTLSDGALQAPHKR